MVGRLFWNWYTSQLAPCGHISAIRGMCGIVEAEVGVCASEFGRVLYARHTFLIKQVACLMLHLPNMFMVIYFIASLTPCRSADASNVAGALNEYEYSSIPSVVDDSTILASNVQHDCAAD